MNFTQNDFVHESAPNRSSRPLNTQLLLEISIRIQWKTFQTKVKPPKIIIISLTPIPLRGQLCIGFGDLWEPSGTSGDHLGTIWDMDSMRLSISLLNRTFRSARIDPSSLPKHRRTNLKKSCRRKKSNIQKELKKDQKHPKRA